MKRLHVLVVLILLLLGVFLVLYFFIGIRTDTPIIIPLNDTYEKVIPHQNIPNGLVSMKAADCGKCHKDHYEEWKTSTHAQAWNDLQFQAELKKESSPFFCINCHIPLQNQQEYIIGGKYAGDVYKPVRRVNPSWDKELQLEGITCAVCHVRNNSIIGPTGTSNAPHKTVKDLAFLSEGLCISCHNISTVVSETLVCSFETGVEWKKGPYFGKKNCIDCHMEERMREVVNGYGERKSHLHYFSGSGIPKHDSLQTTQLKGLEFKLGELKEVFKKEEAVHFSFEVQNVHAGHRVPTGDPERFILIEFELLDAKNNRVHYKSERIGEKWQWYPTVKKLSDNNLNPGETRKYTFNASQLQEGNYTLKINVTKHRIDEKSATYNKLPKEYPRQIEIYRKELRLKII